MIGLEEFSTHTKKHLQKPTKQRLPTWIFAYLGAGRPQLLLSIRKRVRLDKTKSLDTPDHLLLAMLPPFTAETTWLA